MTAPVAVSVLIPCHNSAEFLRDALQSVKDQTFPNFECIIIDDGSTDNTATVAQRFVEADSRFTLLSMNESKGASAARNVGIARAVGAWIALLDADDLYLPERLERLTRIGSLENADLVIDEQLVTNFPRTTRGHVAFGFEQTTFTFTQEDFFAGSRLFRTCLAMGYMKPLIRREFVSRRKAVYDATVLSGEDFLFYAQLFAARPRCIGTSFVGYIYRRRKGSLSTSDTHLHFHAQLGDRILRDLGEQLSSSSRSALLARKRDFDDLAKAMSAGAALRQRNWARFITLLIKHPSVARTFLRRLRTRAGRTWLALTRVAKR